MRKLIIILGTVMFMFASVACGPRPYYKTAKGKRKLRKYNSMQYDRRDAQAPKGKKPKRKKNYNY